MGRNVRGIAFVNVFLSAGLTSYIEELTLFVVYIMPVTVIQWFQAIFSSFTMALQIYMEL